MRLLYFGCMKKLMKARHIAYARQLAERRDTTAENHLLKLVDFRKEENTAHDNRTFWEKHWMNDLYLSSNYRFSFQKDSTNTLSNFYHPVLSFDENDTPIYTIYFPEKYNLSFQLKKDFKRSVYTSNQPYKNLKELRNYHFAVVDQNEVVSC